MVIPKGQIRLPVQTGSDVVEVGFIVVNAFSPYIAITIRTMGTLSRIVETYGIIWTNWSKKGI